VKSEEFAAAIIKAVAVFNSSHSLKQVRKKQLTMGDY
jgi:hypothetical protein